MSKTLKEKIIEVVKSASTIDKKSMNELTKTKGIVLEGALRANLFKTK